MTTVTRQRPEASPRYLSRPAPVELVENDGSGGAWIRTGEHWVKIISLKNLWEIDGYREPEKPVLRMHFRVTTEDGRGILLYQDLLEGQWYRQFTLGN